MELLHSLVRAYPFGPTTYFNVGEIMVRMRICNLYLQILPKAKLRL